MKRFSIVVMLILITSLSGTGAVALNTTVRELRQPTFGMPQFVEAGNNVTVTLELPAAGRATAATLKPSLAAGKTRGIAVDAGLNPGPDRFEFATPADLGAGMYDLCVEFVYSGYRGSDCQPHSVVVVESFEPPFTFVHITDYHLGDPRAEKQFPGVDINRVRLAALEAVNEANPAFAVFSGDITAYPETYNRDYPGVVNELISSAHVPMIIIPGNHDFYTWLENDSRITADGVYYWKDFFGPTHGVLDYGPFRFICFNSYDWESPVARNRNKESFGHAGGIVTYNGTLSRSEYNWLRGALETAGDRRIIMISHHGPRQFEPVPQQWCKDCVGMAKLISLINRYDVPYYFFGHIHRNEDYVDGKTRYISTTSVGSDTGEKELWGIRVARVKPDLKIDIEYIRLFDEPPMKEK